MPMPKSRSEAGSRKSKPGARLRLPDTAQSAPAAHQRRADGSVASHSPSPCARGAFHLRAGAERVQLASSATSARACRSAVTGHEPSPSASPPPPSLAGGGAFTLASASRCLRARYSSSSSAGFSTRPEPQQRELPRDRLPELRQLAHDRQERPAPCAHERVLPHEPRLAALEHELVEHDEADDRPLLLRQRVVAAEVAGVFLAARREPLPRRRPHVDRAPPEHADRVLHARDAGPRVGPLRAARLPLRRRGGRRIGGGEGGRVGHQHRPTCGPGPRKPLRHKGFEWTP